MKASLATPEDHKGMVSAMRKYARFNFNSDSRDTLTVSLTNPDTGAEDVVYKALCKTADGKGNWIVRYAVDLFETEVVETKEERDYRRYNR